MNEIKSVDEMAREYCKHQYDKLLVPELKPLFPSIRKGIAEIELHFLAGHASAISQASEGFEEFLKTVNPNLIEGWMEVQAAKTAWIASRISAQKEIDVLVSYKEDWRDIAGAANLKGLVENNKQLRDDLNWALDKYEFETTSSSYNGISVKVKELRTKYNLNKVEG